MNAGVIAAEQSLGITLPADIAAIYAAADGRYNQQGQWWVVWPLNRLVEENHNAWLEGLPRSFLAFGDDGAGNPFCVDIKDSSEIFRWSWIDLEVERSEGSVAEFLSDWCEESDYP